MRQGNEIGIRGDDCELVGLRPLPYGVVVGLLEADVADVGEAGEEFFESVY